MGAPKGHPKWGGRKKGTPNFKTLLRTQKLSEFEEKLNLHGVDPLSEILKVLPSLEPREQAAIYTALLQYQYPRVKPVELKEESPFAGMDKGQMIQSLRAMLQFLESEKPQNEQPQIELQKDEP